MTSEVSASETTALREALNIQKKCIKGTSSEENETVDIDTDWDKLQRGPYLDITGCSAVKGEHADVSRFERYHKFRYANGALFLRP